MAAKKISVANHPANSCRLDEQRPHTVQLTDIRRCQSAIPSQSGRSKSASNGRRCHNLFSTSQAGNSLESGTKSSCRSSFTTKTLPSMDDPVQYRVQTPNYTLSRTRTTINVELKAHSDVVKASEPVAETSVRVPSRQSQRDVMLDDLQREIDELTLQLQREQSAHHQTRLQSANELKDTIANMRLENSNELRLLTAANGERLSVTKDDLKAQLDACRAKYNSETGNLVREIQMLEAMFATHRSHVQREQSLREKINEYNRKSEAELKSSLSAFADQLKAEKETELRQLESTHAQQMRKLEDDLARSMEEVKKRFSVESEDFKKMEDAEANVKLLEEEIAEKEENYRNICNYIAISQQRNEELKKQLIKFKESLDEQIRRIDQKYVDTINDLTLQYVAMRRLFLKKCSETGRAQDDIEGMPVAMDAKDTIRMLAELRLSTSPCLIGGSGRRLSYPVSNNEIDLSRNWF